MQIMHSDLCLVVKILCHQPVCQHGRCWGLCKAIEAAVHLLLGQQMEGFVYQCHADYLTHDYLNQ